MINLQTPNKSPQSSQAPAGDSCEKETGVEPEHPGARQRTTKGDLHRLGCIRNQEDGARTAGPPTRGKQGEGGSEGGYTHFLQASLFLKWTFLHLIKHKRSHSKNKTINVLLIHEPVHSQRNSCSESPFQSLQVYSLCQQAIRRTFNGVKAAY